MGIFNLFGLCIALLFAPALAFANDVRVGVSPTTGYYEVTSKTFNVPKGATVSPSRAVSTVVTPLSGGGFQQSMGGGITIEGLKKPAPFTARAAAGLQTMKNGAKKLARSNPARFAAGVGFSAFLDSLDWIMKDGAISSSIVDLPNEVDQSFAHYRVTPSGNHPVSYGYTPSQACSTLNGLTRSGQSSWIFSNTIAVRSTGEHYTCYSDISALGTNVISGTAYFIQGDCPPNSTPSSSGCAFSSTSKPVSFSDIDSALDSKYVPHVDDFVLLTPYMSPDFILVDPIPPVITDLGITNTFDSSGWLTGTEQKTSTTEFTVSNNSTSQPSISSSTSVKTETFKDGQSQGSTVTNTTQPAVGGGGGGGKAPTVEIPTDCDFHPTLCAWMNWTKEPLEEPDHDLKQIMHTVDFEEKKTISFGSKTCPAPYDIHLGLIDRTYQLSFQPACDFAGYLYFFVMAAAYIFAAYISVGVVRNG